MHEIIWREVVINSIYRINFKNLGNTELFPYGAVDNKNTDGK